MVALIKHRAALRGDCALADVVIATFPVRWRGCRRAEVVIDRFDLWREGAHALWLRGGAVRIRTVAEASGHRPWNPYEKRRAQSAKGRR
jgi:competence protein ComEC